MTSTSTDKAYRIRVRPYSLVAGERVFREGWMKEFADAAVAAEYWRKAIRLSNHEVKGTRPDGKGGRSWTSREGLLRIAGRK